MQRVVSKDATSIAFDRSGRGPAVVLVGGAFQHRAIDQRTAQLAALLAERFTVVHYDRRGRGDSADTMPYAVEREVEDLGALIKAAGGSAHVFGMCPRGRFSPWRQRRAAFPSRSWRCTSRRSTPEAPTRQASEAYARQLDGLLAQGLRGDAVALAMMTFGAPPQAVEGMRHAPVWQLFGSVAPTLAYDAAIMGDGSVPARRLSTVRVPALVIAGGASPEFMHSAAAAAAAAMPDARHRKLDGQTHDVAPEVLAPVLAEFFSG